jgi:hypothetical protein
MFRLMVLVGIVVCLGSHGIAVCVDIYAESVVDGSGHHCRDCGAVFSVCEPKPPMGMERTSR